MVHLLETGDPTQLATVTGFYTVSPQGFFKSAAHIERDIFDTDSVFLGLR